MSLTISLLCCFFVILMHVSRFCESEVLFAHWRFCVNGKARTEYQFHLCCGWVCCGLWDPLGLKVWSPGWHFWEMRDVEGAGPRRGLCPWKTSLWVGLQPASLCLGGSCHFWVVPVSGSCFLLPAIVCEPWVRQ